MVAENYVKLFSFLLCVIDAANIVREPKNAAGLNLPEIGKRLRMDSYISIDHDNFYEKEEL